MKIKISDCFGQEVQKTVKKMVESGNVCENMSPPFGSFEVCFLEKKDDPSFFKKQVSFIGGKEVDIFVYWKTGGKM